MISSRTVLSSSISSVPLFSRRRIFCRPFPVSPRRLQRLRTLQRPISRYPLTCRRFFTRDTFHPTARAPLLLSEGHWNRIKLCAGFSMPPFPPVAMKGDIRHGDRSDRRKMGRFQRDRMKFPWPLIKRPDAMTEKRKSVAIGLIRSGKRGENKKERFKKKRSGYSYKSLLSLPRSRLSGKTNVSGLFLPVVLPASSISSQLRRARISC